MEDSKISNTDAEKQVEVSETRVQGDKEIQLKMLEIEALKNPGYRAFRELEIAAELEKWKHPNYNPIRELELKIDLAKLKQQEQGTDFLVSIINFW